MIYQIMPRFKIIKQEIKNLYLRKKASILVGGMEFLLRISSRCTGPQFWGGDYHTVVVYGLNEIHQRLLGHDMIE